MSTTVPYVAGEPSSGLRLETVRQDETWPASITDTSFSAAIAAAIGRFVEFDGIETAVIAYSDDNRVRELNVQYRNQDKPTNVLSFPVGDHGAGQVIADTARGRHLGDIILAHETVSREAGAPVNGKTRSLEHHTAHLVVHGILHLLGYDHEDEQEAEEMEALEIDVLSELGIANPYIEELHNVD